MIMKVTVTDTHNWACRYTTSCIINDCKFLKKEKIISQKDYKQIMNVMVKARKKLRNNENKTHNKPRPKTRGAKRKSVKRQPN